MCPRRQQAGSWLNTFSFHTEIGTEARITLQPGDCESTASSWAQSCSPCESSALQAEEQSSSRHGLPGTVALVQAEERSFSSASRRCSSSGFPSDTARNKSLFSFFLALVCSGPWDVLALNDRKQYWNCWFTSLWFILSSAWEEKIQFLVPEYTDLPQSLLYLGRMFLQIAYLQLSGHREGFTIQMYVFKCFILHFFPSHHY